MQILNHSCELMWAVHIMEAVSAAGFCKLLAALSRRANRGVTPTRICQDGRKLFVPVVAGREIFVFQTPTALDAATLILFSGYVLLP